MEKPRAALHRADTTAAALGLFLCRGRPGRFVLDPSALLCEGVGGGGRVYLYSVPCCFRTGSQELLDSRWITEPPSVSLQRFPVGEEAYGPETRTIPLGFIRRVFARELSLWARIFNGHCSGCGRFHAGGSENRMVPVFALVNRRDSSGNNFRNLRAAHNAMLISGWK